MTTEIDNQELIKCVSNREAIWNKQDKHYHCRLVIERCWSEISNELQVPKEALKKKWKYLRDQFRTELKKIPIQPDEEAKIEMTWPYFNAMYFLKGQIRDSLANSSVPTTSVQGTSRNFTKKSKKPKLSNIALDNGLFDTNILDTVDVKPNIINKFTNSSAITPLSTAAAELLKIEKRKLEIMEMNTPLKKERDEDEAFFDSLLPYIRKLNSEQKLLCRMDIQNTIYKFVYNQTISENATTVVRSNEQQQHETVESTRNLSPLNNSYSSTNIEYIVDTIPPNTANVNQHITTKYIKLDPGEFVLSQDENVSANTVQY